MQYLGAWPTQNGPHYVVNFDDIDDELITMRRMIDKWRQSPEIRELALSIVSSSGIPSKDKRGQAIAIATYVQKEIYYIHELPERINTPIETLRTKHGDCDDLTVLIGSLLETIGIFSSIVCMKINGEWSHVFPAALNELTEELLPLDVTMDLPVSEVPNPVEWANSAGKSVTLKLA